MNKLNHAFQILAILAVAVAFDLTTARISAADPMGFSCISDNNSTDCAILESQIFVDVSAGAAPNTVTFTFSNTGPLASSITAVYFDDLSSPLLGGTAIIADSGDGVSFGTGCSPGNLSSGQSHGFLASYCADSDSPTQPMGVNPGESLSITYTLQGGATLATLLTEIQDGDYRIGVRVQGFTGGGSESGINSVPEPTSLFIVTTGLLLGIPILRRRRRQ